MVSKLYNQINVTTKLLSCEICLHFLRYLAHFCSYFSSYMLLITAKGQCLQLLVVESSVSYPNSHGIISSLTNTHTRLRCYADDLKIYTSTAILECEWDYPHVRFNSHQLIDKSLLNLRVSVSTLSRWSLNCNRFSGQLTSYPF